MIRHLILVVMLSLAGTLLTAHASAQQSKLDFNRDIRPIFAASCFPCHGPDEDHREAGLRLDIREEALDAGVIEPGDSTESELLRRILATDPDEIMPPPSAGHPLTPEQKQRFAQWIDEGAEYSEHWAFQPPTRPTVPSVDSSWPRNPIDNFVLAKQQARDLTPAPEADRYTLVRRLYLDLIGLPPTPEQADAFVGDDAPDAYQRLVDELLSSPHYGERWARNWLDLARYSDTNGYEKDRERSIWLYRDWVIKALNDDMPFDQFTVEQLAGDLLQDPTPDQLIATGFHRNTMLNEEGGIDPLEYRFYAMVDRVATTGTVWLGLSTGCAQCHTHKYDPITHTDYYRMMALMNNANEPDYVVKPADLVERRAKLLNQIKEMESTLAEQYGKLIPSVDASETPISPDSDPDAARRNLQADLDAWIAQQAAEAIDWSPLAPIRWKTNLPRLQILPDLSLLATGDTTKRDVYELTFSITEDQLPLSGLRLEVIPDERLPDQGPGNAFYEGRKGTFFLSEVELQHAGQRVELHSTTSSDQAEQEPQNQVFDGNGSSGWSTPPGQAHHLVIRLDQPITHAGELNVELVFERHFVASLGRFRFSTTSANSPKATQLPVEIENLLTDASTGLSPEAREKLQQQFLLTTPLLAEARKPIEELRKKMPAFPTTMILKERAADNPRATFRHHRGEFTSPREEVAPGVPGFLIDDAETGPSNRLEFAQWLASEKNPLVARVAVNRAWQSFFGVGLQRTPDDFGTQSEPPTHPELLDWLASEFIESGGSRKELHRLIVCSATYRQQSYHTEEILARDPENQWLSRGPRFRVDAEMVRDILLKSSGLLSTTMYGPSVRPPQPQSVMAAAYGSPKWNVSQGKSRYRRSLYTFSKRTAPFAAYTVFDAPTGENCVARRDRSNTPLQALTLMNDPMYLEYARAMAKEVLTTEQSDPEIAMTIFRRLCTRPAQSDELASIVEFYQRQMSRLEQEQLSAKDILGEDENNNRTAAWTLVARALMNLDEVVSKP